ncbi:uncharacterized protein LOC126586638 [Malus sylvestris]|uniref:Disease resistance N-terminal domain-containing protein n=1 Tax=Malus domestica TaxID=3750 RepID=A0A498KA35_MALDO|nr:uncharacterized protein LOC126586638 [Malus sylvestris]RXI05180.1 hypothetical protein DVH24_006437 [Malus domestica]
MAGSFMGQDFLSASVQVLCDRMASRELRDLFSQGDLDYDSLDRLRGKLSTLCAVLNYVKQQQVTNPAVRDWLGKLRDVVFDVEDLLGEINSTSTAQVLQRPTDGLTTKVLNFLSTSFKLCGNNRGVNCRIEELLQILEHLAEQKDGLYDEMPDLWDERPASSFLFGVDYGSGSSPNNEIYELRHGKKAASAEWPFLFISLCLEILSVACDQASSPSKPRYALFGMLLAIVGVLICVLEFIYKGIKGRVELRRWGKLWWFYYPPPPCYKPLGTVVEISGLIGGIAQCVTSIIQYVYFSQHLDSPFKVSLYPAILVICLIASRLSKDRRWIREGAGAYKLTKSKMVD